jgi:hypothetical protein
MSPEKISAIRSANQQISQARFKTAEELISWMGAMQAQDYNMVKWAFGIRMPGSTLESISNEIDSGRIIRTHVLRPTWHFVSSDDIFWMTSLSAAHIRSALSVRDKQLGLDSRIFSKCNKSIEKILSGNKYLTRDELFTELVKSGLKIKREQAYHIFTRSEVDGIICSGRQRGGKPSFALLNEWVPKDRKKYTREESLKELADRYFTSRGPATVRDFAWWSGLSLTEARSGLEHNRSALVSEKYEDLTYWFSAAVNGTDNFNNIFLLPAYDEFLLSYRDRSDVITFTDQKKAVSNNGIFYPIILSGNQIVGTWKRKDEKGRINISTALFQKGAKLQKEEMKNVVKRYSEFFGRETVVKNEIH